MGPKSTQQQFLEPYSKPPRPPLKERLREGGRIIKDIFQYPLESSSIISAMVVYLAFYCVAITSFSSGTVALTDWAYIFLPAMLFYPMFIFLGWAPLLLWYTDLSCVAHPVSSREAGKRSIVASLLEALVAFAVIFESPLDAFDPNMTFLLIAVSQCIAGVSCFLETGSNNLRIPKAIFTCVSIIALVAAIGPVVLA